MTDNLTIADILERAADLIEPEGSWSGGGARHNGGNCHCTALAVDYVAGKIGHPDGIEARKLFAKFIGLNEGCAETFGIYRWNDDPNRTQSEVVAKLREAAAKARAEG